MHHKAHNKTTKEVKWFKNKQYGMGWYPITWQGYGVLLFYVLDVFFTVKYFSSRALTFQTMCTLVGLLMLYTSVVLLICYIKGEKPHWNWVTS